MPGFLPARDPDGKQVPAGGCPEMHIPGFHRKGGRGRKAESRALLRYDSGESILHRLDPRTKILLLLLVSLAAIFFTSLIAMTMLFLFVLALALISGLEKKLARAFLLISPFLAIIIILDSLFPKVSSGPVWFSAGAGFLHTEVTLAGILFAITMGLRFLSIAGFSFLFIMTTSHDDFMKSLKSMRVPATLSFSLGYALRSTTTLSEDVHNIMDAQRSRGLDFENGGLVKNRTNLMALFTPVTVSLLRRSKQVTDAMQSRGFNRNAPITCYNPCRFSRLDGSMVLWVVGLILSLVLIDRIIF
jgi:energy-coupling factor transport system permease protein